MRELTNTEIEAVSGAGIKIEGKCYVFKGREAVAFFIGYVAESLRQILGSGSGSGKPDPWG